MENDAIIVIHGFLQLPNLQKLKVVEAMNDYFDSMEKEVIRAKPEYWLWSHRRWKHKRPEKK